MKIGIEGNNLPMEAMGHGRSQARRRDAASGTRFQDAHAAIGADKIVEQCQQRQRSRIAYAPRASIGCAIERPCQGCKSVSAHPGVQCLQKCSIPISITSTHKWVGYASKEVAPLRILTPSNTA